MSTKVEQALRDAEAEHASDPERAHLLAVARQFKASWLELGQALSTVKRTGQWRNWGYPSFDDYAKKELRLRQETIDKLTASYSFLQKRAPEVLERDALETQVPTYQAIDFLRRAEANVQEERSPEKAEALRTLHTKLVDEGVPLAKIKREFAPVFFPVDAEAQAKKDAAALRGLATRMLDLVRGSRALSGAPQASLQAALETVLRELGNADKDEHAA